MSAFLRVSTRDRLSTVLAVGRAMLACLLAFPAAVWAADAAPLSLAEAVRLASHDSPAISAQQSALDASQAQVLRAPQLPDPQLVVGIDSLPLAGPERFSLTRDGMTMHSVGVMQEFPRKEKRRLRGTAAQAQAQVEAARLGATRLEVQREAALAWIDRSYAEREALLLQDLLGELDHQIKVVQAALAGGAGSAADVLAVQAQRAQLVDRSYENARSLAQANASLERWLGSDVSARALDAEPDFSAPPEVASESPGAIARQGALLPAAALEYAAQAQVELARAEKKPDWSVEVAYGHRGPAYADMLSVQFRVDLPLFPARRQDAEIAARLAERDQREAEHAQALRAAREKTRTLLSAWNSASGRVRNYHDSLLPLAQQRATVALAAYSGGRGGIEPVLGARNAVIETRLGNLAQERERARAWIELNYLWPSENTP